VGGGSYIPLLGSWKWWDGDSWETQETAITGVANSQELRLRLCVHETGGKAGSNQDVQLVYSLNSDLSGAVEFGAPTDTDKVFRWRDDSGITEHDAIVGTQLSCNTESGLSHEQTCSNSEDVSAAAHHELEVIFEPYDLAGETTYYIGLVFESTTLGMNGEISAYPNLTSGAIATEHYQTVTDIGGLVDSESHVWVGHLTQSDIAGLLDSVVAALATSQTVGDIQGLLDTVSLALGFHVTASDIQGLLDSVAVKQAFKKPVSDIAGLLDSVGVVHTPGGGGTAYFQTASDVSGLLDSVEFIGTYHSSQADIAGLLDSVSVTHTPGAPTPPSPTGGRGFSYRRRPPPRNFLIDNMRELRMFAQFLRWRLGLDDELNVDVEE